MNNVTVQCNTSQSEVCGTDSTNLIRHTNDANLTLLRVPEQATSVIDMHGDSETESQPSPNSQTRGRLYKLTQGAIRNPLSLLRPRTQSSAFLERPLSKTVVDSSSTSKRRFTINFPQRPCDEAEHKFVQYLETDSSKVGIGGDNSILQEIRQDPWLETPRERSWSVVNLKQQFIGFFQPANNRLAMKLFGNKVALACERRRQREQGKWVIHPCSNFRLYWNLIMLILLIANLIMLPVIISFFNDDMSVQWMIFNGISDAIFFTDIIVNFRTGIIRNDFVDDIILDPKEIAREYLRTWFVLDFLSSIPIDYVLFAFRSSEVEGSEQLVQAGRALRILRLAKLLSLLRLLRLSRLVRYITQWEEVVSIANKFMGICNLVLIMLLLGHWNACLQFLVPMLMDFPVQSWVSKSHLQNAHWFEQYTWALFKALSHMLSIGYGRYPPSSLPEAWITIISMMTGATCYALFVGHAAALIQSFDASKRKYREMLKQVEEYMAFKKYPPSLRQRITGYFEHRYKGKMFNEKEILGELSECLREQILNYNCRALVATVPIFANADQNFVSEVVVRLKQEVFQPGDLIIKEGTWGNKMYFIQEGVVNIITKSGTIVTRLTDGCYFGEICLLTNAKRVATVQADTYCTLYSLDQKHFYEVLENFPAMRQTMEKVAAERLQNIGQRASILKHHSRSDEPSADAARIADQIMKHERKGRRNNIFIRMKMEEQGMSGTDNEHMSSSDDSEVVDQGQDSGDSNQQSTPSHCAPPYVDHTLSPVSELHEGCVESVSRQPSSNADEESVFKRKTYHM